MNSSIQDIQFSPQDRVYALGDVHGCYQELLELEKTIVHSGKRQASTSFKMISVGDLCDRGPATKDVIEHFAQGSEAGTHHVILGNHESYFILAMLGQRKDLVDLAGIQMTWYHELLTRVFPKAMVDIGLWTHNGGASFFQSYGADISKSETWDVIPLSHIRLIFNAPLIIRMPDIVVSNALLWPGDIELFDAKERSESMDEVLLCEALVRCLWSRDLPGSRLDPKRRHISGHTPMEQVGRFPKKGILQIDTGAVYGMSLTALNLKNFRAVSVPSHFNCRKDK